MKSDLQAMLDSLDVKMSAEKTRSVYTGEWPHDEWECTISYSGKKHVATFKTGLGHRKSFAVVERSGDGFYNRVAGAYARDLVDACALGWFKAVKPASADVVSCLLSDASSAKETFESWCNDMGLDSDSRKAFATYQECMATRDAMVRLFGMKLSDDLSSLEH